MRKSNGKTRGICKLNLKIPTRNQIKLSTGSLKFYRPKTWNTLPLNVKTALSINTFTNKFNEKVESPIMQMYYLYSSMVRF